MLPTLGGQTALNLTVQLEERGVLNKWGVEVLGASIQAIKKAEDRRLFKESMTKVGIEVPRSGQAYSLEEAIRIAKEIGFPLVIRPSFTLGGTGGAIAYNIEEFEDLAQQALDSSLIREILIEESVAGWKEFELEVMRDAKDNVVVICSIENFDPMGIHTGDSITVAPAQTLTDQEYELMRDLAIKVIREIGVDTGGCNIQFAVNPQNGRIVIIEINPRVSRSSALASKATGFPIAKIAAKLAIGYTLDEIPNDITRKTPASFEPALDYCVVKIPRFTFEKFPETEPWLGISMKSVGETMAIGRNFKEALQKGLRSLEIGKYGLEDIKNWEDFSPGKRQEILRERLAKPNAERVFYIKMAIKEGLNIEEIYNLTKIDPWFIHEIVEIVEMEEELKHIKDWKNLNPESGKRAKEFGFSDHQLAEFWNTEEEEVRRWREEKGIEAVYKQVDTVPVNSPKLLITILLMRKNVKLTPQREKRQSFRGRTQSDRAGIEFDYCCVHATWGLRDLGYETIMVNSNPETVSTDYDTLRQVVF